jgi:hypothetical protein
VEKYRRYSERGRVIKKIYIPAKRWVIDEIADAGNLIWKRFI